MTDTHQVVTLSQVSPLLSVLHLHDSLLFLISVLEYSSAVTTTQSVPLFPQALELPASFKRTSARPNIQNLFNSINGAKMDHWLQVHVIYVGGMFVSVIELSPRSTLIELPIITHRPV